MSEEADKMQAAFMPMIDEWRRSSECKVVENSDVALENGGFVKNQALG
ncbi:MAG: hypothetical protein ISN28_16215 [Ectothiorhodospiraceae bacterium AqS1]|nr:hypothetical protein [Ectothiorhodospiraceae bacterium AqS1]MBF2761779.1 hypothetical protein [Ectothiorhodospiraceae bacterium AqS1]